MAQTRDDRPTLVSSFRSKTRHAKSDHLPKQLHRVNSNTAVEGPEQETYERFLSGQLLEEAGEEAVHMGGLLAWGSSRGRGL